MIEIEKKSDNLSVKGYIWQLYQCNERDITTLIQKTGLHQLIVRILIRLGITTHDQIDYHLNPTIRDLLPNPFHLKDIEKAALRVIKAIENNERIVVFGDYDVDGATSTALLIRFFRMIGVDIGFYIPDRFTEGYGPNKKAFDYIKKNDNASVVITVDCGTVAFEPIAYAKNIELDVIVIDHHLSIEILPEAYAIINPNRIDESSPCGNMAAVGVCYLFAIAVNKLLREKGYFKDRKEPNLLGLLDLVALGTVCDVVPIDLVNRAFIKQGIKILAQRANVGLAAICDRAGLKDYPTVYHLGYMIGPRINAAGRIGESELGTKLLSSENKEIVVTIAEQLEKNNQQRKTIEQLVLDEAIIKAQIQLDEWPIIMVYQQGWHEGVIGIVAGRIKDSFNKPSVVISINKGIGKASCRSIKGIDFGSMVAKAKAENLLIAGGGHAMAAGFSVEEHKIEQLQKFFAEIVSERLRTSNDHHLRYFDAYISLSGITKDLALKIEQVGPFGAGCPEPKFLITDAIIQGYAAIQNKHLKLTLIDNNQNKAYATIFRAFENGLADLVDAIRCKKIRDKYSLIATVSVTRWTGFPQAQIIIEDIIIEK